MQLYHKDKQVDHPSDEPETVPTESAEKENDVRPTSTKLIGYGAFCMVYSGMRCNKPVAFKCPREHVWKKNPTMAWRRATNEAHILRSLNHPNVVKFIALDTHRKPTIISEMVTGYTLRACMKKDKIKSCITPEIKVKIMTQLLGAISYLHSRDPKVVHKDLKSENILLDLDCNVKICDFGDAEVVQDSILRYTATTWCYSPPEFIANYMYKGFKIRMDEKVDIWAAGFVILELCGFPTPYERLLKNSTRSEQANVIARFLDTFSESIPVPAGIPTKIRKVLRNMLQKDPRKRPSASKILEWTLQHRSTLCNEFALLKC